MHTVSEGKEVERLEQSRTQPLSVAANNKAVRGMNSDLPRQNTNIFATFSDKGHIKSMGRVQKRLLLRSLVFLVQ